MGADTKPARDFGPDELDFQKLLGFDQLAPAATIANEIEEAVASALDRPVRVANFHRQWIACAPDRPRTMQLSYH